MTATACCCCASPRRCCATDGLSTRSCSSLHYTRQTGTEEPYKSCSLRSAALLLLPFSYSCQSVLPQVLNSATCANSLKLRTLLAWQHRSCAECESVRHSATLDALRRALHTAFLHLPRPCSAWQSACRTTTGGALALQPWSMRGPGHPCPCAAAQHCRRRRRRRCRLRQPQLPCKPLFRKQWYTIETPYAPHRQHFSGRLALLLVQQRCLRAGYPYAA